MNLRRISYRISCIVSSDSDFTRLAARLRESEMYVLGMGEQKTPLSFISACNKFSYIDLLYAASEPEVKQEKKTKAEVVKYSKGLKRCGCTVFPGSANYLFFSSKKEIAADLLARGFLIRSWTENAAENGRHYYRIAVRRHAENVTFLKTLQEIL